MGQVCTEIPVHCSSSIFTREKWTQFKMLPIMVGLLVMTAGMLSLLHNACTAVRLCLFPSIGADIAASTTDVDKAAQGGGPAAWLLGLWELLAVRPTLLPGLAMGAGFLSMAAYSDNFTIYVSRLLVLTLCGTL